MSSSGLDWREGLREAAPYMHLGFQLFAAILLFCGGGFWLDRTLGTLPWLTLGGAVLALVAILALVLNVDAESRKRESRKRAARSPDTDGRGGHPRGDAYDTDAYGGSYDGTYDNSYDNTYDNRYENAYDTDYDTTYGDARAPDGSQSEGGKSGGSESGDGGSGDDESGGGAAGDDAARRRRGGEAGGAA